jgi:hypothetical protein
VALSPKRELTPVQVTFVCAGWLVFAVSAFVYVRVSVWLNQPFHEGVRHLRYFDLKVYRGAAKRIVNGQTLYGRPIRRRLGFTYPPAAALLMLPLSLFAIRGDELIVTALNGAALIFVLRQTLLIEHRHCAFAALAAGRGLVCRSSGRRRRDLARTG